MRPIIKSKKHISQIALFTVGQALHVNTDLIVAQEATSTTPTAVEEGAIVKACYVELWVGSESASTIGSYTVALYKNPGGNAAMTSGNLAALHDYDNKKNILFTAQALVPPDVAGVIPVLRSWYKIPKGKQRFGLGDKLMIGVRNNNPTAVDQIYCGLAVYKEYT